MPTDSESLPAQALQGVRVLDLSRVLAGPWCTQTLADLGADVIKVERPLTGDDTRGWGPPYLKDAAGADTSEAAYYLAANRNKRSITVDLASTEGQALVRRIAAQSDVVVENYKVGDMARYRLDAPTMLARNPRLVYCSITGFGQTGPYRERAGYDYAAQGIGGLMSVTGPSRAEIADDAPGGGPQKVGVAVADLFTGMYASTAILAALRHRDRTGVGQSIDMALLDTQVAMLANLGANYLVSGVVPQRAGNAHQNVVPYQVFEVSDGHLILAVGNDAQFERFCAVAGLPELALDPRFVRNAGRVRKTADGQCADRRQPAASSPSAHSVNPGSGRRAGDRRNRPSHMAAGCDTTGACIAAASRTTSQSPTRPARPAGNSRVPASVAARGEAASRATASLAAG